MAHKVFGVLLAAGYGRRFGGDVPKAFFEINGKSIVQRSLECMHESNVFHSITVVVPSAMIEEPAVHALLGAAVQAISGGKERSDSVKAALAHLTARGAAPDDIVVVHDAARCFAVPELFRRAVEGVVTHGAVSVGIPSTDSLKVVSEEGFVVRSLERKTIWRAQTPQAFRFGILVEAHERFPAGATDDASLVESFHRVKMIPGTESNRKVTWRSDVA